MADKQVMLKSLLCVGLLFLVLVSSADAQEPVRFLELKASVPGDGDDLSIGRTQTNIFRSQLNKRSRIRRSVLPDQLGPATADIVPIYKDGFPNTAKPAVEYAIAIWETLIVTDIPILLEVYWEDLGPDVAVTGGDYHFVFTSDSYYTPMALLEKATGVNQNGSNPDMQIVLNSLGNYYFGTDGNLEGDQYDLVTAAMWGIASGLGLGSELQVQSEIGFWEGKYNLFDFFIANGSGLYIVNYYPNESTQLAAQMQSDNLYFFMVNSQTINEGIAPKLYAPNPWDETALHTLDPSIFTGTGEGLRLPTINQGEVHHMPGPITLAMLLDMGWHDGPPGQAIAPGGFTATALNSTQIELSWSHPGGIVFFPIFLNGVHIDEVSANGRSKIIDGLQPGVVYCFQVAAHNQYQQSMLSNPQCIPTLPELTAPNVPDDFDATLIDGSIIRLNWNDVSEETFYLIYEDGDQIDTVTANTTSFQITEGVEPNGVQRCFTVRAQNDAGVSDHSIRDCLKVADDTGYYISGRVTTPDGGFLPEVEIVIDFEHFTKTNGAGLFTFRELENQTYTVSPSKCGYQIQPQTVSLDYDDVLLEFEAVPVEGIDVCIDHIDIRQTFVDDYDRQLEQSIPLIGGKLTVARVFVDISGAAEVQNLNIKLYQRTPHGTITSIAHPHEFSSRSAKPNSNRYNYLDSSNFVLWAPNTTESVTYWAEVNSDEQDTNLFNNVGGYTTVTFQKGYPLEINVAKVNYQPNETFHCPLVEDDKFGYASDRVDDAYRWAEQVLPVSHIEVVPIEFHEPFVLPLHSRIDGICKNTHTHEYNEWVKTVRRKIPANKRKSVLFTWLPGHIRREGIIAQYIVNKIAWALDNEVVYPWLMGHELAHSLTGVTHIKKDGCMGIDIESWPIQYPPDEKIQEWGLYIPSQDMYGVNIMKNPEDTYDLLSYCDDKEIETAWIAPWTYIKAYGSMPLLRTKFTKPLQPFVTIRGSVYKDGRVEIRGLLRSAWHEPGNSHELGSEYCVETQTKDHTLLDSFCFDLSFKEEIGGAPLDSAGFFIDLPDKQEVGRVVLKHLGNIIGSKEPSANIPQISLLSPNGGETWSANGEQMIRWEASDLDGDELRYELDYYDGQNWDPIAVEVYTTEYWIDTSRLAGGDQIKIKVTANDGWHEASDESDEVLTVGSKPPILKLLEPSNNHQVNPGYTIYFRGRAHDVEDGSLKDRMIWESNLDGELGQGNRIIAALSQGVHTITLSVTDGDENQVEEIITLYVGVEPLTEPPFQTHWQYLPLILE